MRETWIPMGCARSRSTTIAHFQFADGSWYLLDARKTEKRVVRAGESSALTGTFLLSPEYPGCPGCHADSIVCCNTCGELSCWQSSDQRFTCASCGAIGLVSGR